MTMPKPPSESSGGRRIEIRGERRFQDCREEMSRRFRDRADAGRALGVRLAAYAHRPDVSVLALPRGGVPVAFEIAKALQAPMDVFLVRKLGVPGREELAMGAIATGGVRSPEPGN